MPKHPLEVCQRVFQSDGHLLRRAALARARSEREVVDAVTVARSSGVSWNKIGEILGTSAQAAQQR
jgi:hypothetical protein